MSLKNCCIGENKFPTRGVRKDAMAFTSSSAAAALYVLSCDHCLKPTMNELSELHRIHHLTRGSERCGRDY